MTETTTSTADASKRRGDALSGMLLPELRQLAQQLGISGSSGMRKGDLIGAISDRQKTAGAGRRGAQKGGRCVKGACFPGI